MMTATGLGMRGLHCELFGTWVFWYRVQAWGLEM